MTTTIYLVRHGYSIANEKNIFLGHGDMALTERGHLQAKVASEYLSTLNPDVIYSSDLIRAKDTAKPTAEKLGLEVGLNSRLREIDAGKWDFMPFLDWIKNYPEEFQKWVDDKCNARCVGGETILELKDRIVGEIEALVKKHQGKTIMIFSHANPIQVFSAYATGDFRGNLNKIGDPPNVSTTKIEYNDGKFTLIEYGKADYLGDIVTKLPTADEI